MKNAVIYARYSSEKQTEQSIEGQIHVCSDFAQRNDYNIINIYTDRATTGRNDQRAGFQQMLADSDKRNFEAVIVYKLDRFSRNRYDSAHNKNILKKNGVRVISATENISDNPEGILLESLLEGLAEYYSAELAQKVTRGIKESVLKGQFTGGSIPYGFDIVNKHYVINQTEAKVIKKIYEMFLDGDSFKSIMTYLEQNKIYNKKGKKFQLHQITNILSKDLYIGTLRGTGITLENKIPAIVSKEEFEKAQLLLTTRRKCVKESNFILTGKLYCGNCGTMMIGSSGTGRSQTYFYYTCKKDKYRIKKDEIEQLVYENTAKFLADEKKVEKMKDSLDVHIKSNNNFEYQKSLEDKIKKIDKELENITNAILLGVINDEIKNKNAQLLSDKEHFITELDKLKFYPSILSGENVVSFLKSLITENTLDNKEKLVKILVNKVIYTKEEVLILLNLSKNIDENKKELERESINILLNGSSNSDLVDCRGLEPRTL